MASFWLLPTLVWATHLCTTGRVQMYILWCVLNPASTGSFLSTFCADHRQQVHVRIDAKYLTAKTMEVKMCGSTMVVLAFTICVYVRTLASTPAKSTIQYRFSSTTPNTHLNNRYLQNKIIFFLWGGVVVYIVPPSSVFCGSWNDLRLHDYVAFRHQKRTNCDGLWPNMCQQDLHGISYSRKGRKVLFLKFYYILMFAVLL